MGIDEKAEIKVPAHDRVPPHQAAAEKIAATGKGGVEAGAEIFQFPTKAVQRSMEQFSNMFGLAGHGTKIEEAVHRSTRNLDAIMQCSTELVKGNQKITHIWLDGIQTHVRHNVENIGSLLGCRTLMEFIAVQSDIVRQSMEDMMQNNLRLSETSSQIARTAAGSCSPSAG